MTSVPDENFLYVFKGARYAVASGRPPRRAGRAACSVRSRRAASVNRYQWPLLMTAHGAHATLLRSQTVTQMPIRYGFPDYAPPLY